MTDDQALVAYRLERAAEALREAQHLAQGKFWNATANRVYYACFYALSAAFLREGKTPLTHAGVKAMFNKDFVRNGRVSADFGLFYNQLFGIRQDSDYKDLVWFTAEIIEPLLLEAEKFVETISKLATE